MCDEDGCIADNLDRAFDGVGFQAHPLPEEQKLAEFLSPYRLLQFPASALQRVRLAGTDGKRPIRPGTSPLRFFDRHEQSKVLQPESLRSTELVQFTRYS